MDLDRSTLWGSLKQKTRPLLQNFNIKRTRKSSRKMVDGRQRQSFDRRLSLSVPDLLESGSVAEESTYTDSQALPTYIPSILSSSVVSLKSSSTLKWTGEDRQWREQGSVRTEINTTETEVIRVSEPRRKSSIDFFALLQRAHLSGDLTDAITEHPCGGLDLDSSMSSQLFDEQIALEEGNDSLSSLPSSFTYLLTIHLKQGRNLVIRDRCVNVVTWMLMRNGHTEERTLPE